MPGNDFDQEALLAFVSELTKRVEDLKKEVASIGAQAGTGMQKLGEETERLGRTFDRDAKSLKGMREQGAGLVGMMRGAAGLGVAFYGAGQAMENFARNSLQSLRNFATDVGLTTTEVNKLKTQLTAAGIDGSQANQQLSSLTAKLDNIKIYGTASPVYKAIAVNDPILARQLADAEKAGNRMKSVDAIVQRWNTGPRSQLYITGELGVTPSMMQALERNRQGLVQPREYSPEELQKYNDQWHNVTQTVINLLGATAMTITSQTNQFMENTKREFSGISSWFGRLKSDFEGKGKPGEQVFGPKGVLPNKQEVESLFGPKGILPNKQEMNDALDGLKRLFSTEAHAALPTGRDTLLEGADSFSQRFGDWNKQKLDVDRDSNKVLQDIRDLLEFEEEETGPGGGGGGGGGGDGAAPGGPPSGAPPPGGPPGGPPPPHAPHGAPAGPGDGAAVPGVETSPYVVEQQGSVARTRKGRLSDATRGYLDYAGAKTGLQAHVVSGGQRMHGAPGAVGSHRHDQGGAGDIKLWDPVAKRYLDMRNPEDAKRMEEYAKEAVRGGAKGIGAGLGYMGPSTMHIGGGSERSWGGASWIERARRAGVQAGPPTAEEREQARKRIDKAAGNTNQNQSARVEVEFNGVPKGVKTDAELLDEGVFSILNIKKSQAAAQPQAD